MRDPAINDLDALLDRQKRAWVAGERLTVEQLLNGSAQQLDAERLLDLIYNEVVLREDLGEAPTLEEYAGRYPQLREELQLHFEVHAALRGELLADTRRVTDSDAATIDEPGLAFGPYLEEYEVLAPIGQGGMGVVYKARHRRLRRLVALKMFQPGRVPSPRER